MLHVASVIGREFQLDVLQRVHAQPDKELEDALEEAVDAGLVEERSATATMIAYKFTHAFFQQTLHDEILAPRRMRLHQQVARALEQVYARRLDEHAAELAEHYSFSTDASDLSKAVSYGELAANRATEIFAYGEAARQLERALAIQDLVNPDDRGKRCDLLLALGESLIPTGENERVIAHVAPDAMALAEVLDDRRRAFRSCRVALDALVAEGAGFNGARPDYLTWAERAIQYAEPDSIERAHANLAMALARHSLGQFAQARALRLEALELARQHGDTGTLFGAAGHLLAAGAPQHWDERVRLAEEASGWPRLGASSQFLGVALFYCGMVWLAQGERPRAEGARRELQELADRTRAATAGLFMAAIDSTLAIVDGRLEEAVERITRYVERGDESGAPVRARQFGVMMLIAPAQYLGRPDLWLTAADEYGSPATLARPGRPASFFIQLTAMRAMCFAQLGRLDEARALVGPLLDEVDGNPDNEVPMRVLIFLLETAVVLEHRVAAEALAARLGCVSQMTGEISPVQSVARRLGDAAVLRGDRVAAGAGGGR